MATSTQPGTMPQLALLNRLTGAQAQLDDAMDAVAAASARRTELMEEAINQGVTIYRIAKHLGVNRRVVEKALTR